MSASSEAPNRARIASGDKIAAGASRWSEQLPVFLLTAMLVLYPFARLVEMPLALMALLGLWLLLRHWNAFWDLPTAAPLAAVFLCWWGPVVLSGADAIAPQETWRVAASLSRYFLAGVFVIWTLREQVRFEQLLRYCAVLLALWIADALLQSLLGFNALGMARLERLNGVFGEHHLKFGPVLAVLLPLLLEYARRCWPKWIRLLIFVAALAVILLSGTRSAWIMFAVMSLIYLWRAWRSDSGKALRLAVAVLVLVAVTSIVLYQTSDLVHQRVDSSLRLLEGSIAGAEEATSTRLPIWRTAGEIFMAHPINGVGARGFRDDYPFHAGADDPWVNAHGDVGALYAHHYLLELMSETGLFGVIGFALLALVLVQAWSRAGSRRRQSALPYGLALMLAFFPLNTHYAIYSTFWGTLLWWLIIVFLAALGQRPATEQLEVSVPSSLH